MQSRTRERTRTRADRGMTLIELMVVMAIIALLSGGIYAGSGQLAGSRLKRAATSITSAVRVAYTRSTATSKSMRVVFDIDAGKIWLEEAAQPMLVTARGKSALGGSADPVTDAEKAANEEAARIIKGPTAPRAAFKPVKAMGFADTETGESTREFAREIKIRSVQTAHDEEPRTSGRAYLYFWPGGQTERASIQLRIGTSTAEDDGLSLLVSPLTGKVTIKNGVVALEKTVDKDGSEREDTAF